jgi:prepilin-type N-terminal cleavage/methylation domain-containing protein
MAYRSQRGVTLLELLVVIVIFAMLLGFSAYLLRGANRDLGVAASANHVVSLLRAAHQQARGGAAPAWVVLNTQRNSIHLVTKETVGEWHLEDPPETGAFGKHARISSGTSVVGRVGRAVQLAGSGTIHCGEVPVYAPDQGIGVELWILRKQAARGVVCTIGDQVEIAAEGNGAITARVGSLTASSGQVRLPLDAWCYVQMIYSGRDLRLALNSNPVAAVAGKAQWTVNSPFIVGSQRGGFAGIVDEVRLSLLLPRDEYLLSSESAFEFPPETPVPPGGEVVIGFDSEGRLDAGLNPQPVRFAIKSSVARHEITVQTGGSVQQKQADTVPPPAVPGAGAAPVVPPSTSR